MIIEEINRVKSEGISEEDYNRVKKVLWGQHIRSQNDVEDLSVEFLQMHMAGIDYFDYYDVYKSVTFEDVKKRLENHFVPERSALSVVNPVDGDDK